MATSFYHPFVFQEGTPTVNGNLFDSLCACLEHYPGEHSADFMRCPPATPFVGSVSFIKCGGHYIPTGVDCMGASQFL